ncbi:MAG: hypothetical protein KGR26_03335 [Cyanobacteria bacterium REEB65]|nr:hypothetical protein [Cyanobacteria bacterium REEB65]
MSEDLGVGFDVEVLATTLKQAHKEATSLVEFVADQLASALPDRTTVTRGGFFWSSKRPLLKVKVRFEEVELRLERRSESGFQFEKADIVGGISIRTHRCNLDDWLGTLLCELSKVAVSSDQVVAFLRKYGAP